MSIPSARLKSRISGFTLEDARGAFSKPNLRLQTLNLRPQKSVGLSLIELIVFMVIVSAAVVGVLGALGISTRSSADPMMHKQALAIAEAVLEEVQLMPYTYCDPDDPQAATAQSAAVGATGCTAAASVEAIGAEATPPYGPETRLSVTTPYDNVNDYNTFSMTGMTDISGTPIAGLGEYTVVVSVAGQAFAALGGGRAIPAADSLLVTVTVTRPAGNVSVTLHGYRVRYAPNALP
jgi:MSHA pilin protein MshD